MYRDTSVAIPAAAEKVDQWGRQAFRTKPVDNGRGQDGFATSRDSINPQNARLTVVHPVEVFSFTKYPFARVRYAGVAKFAQVGYSIGRLKPQFDLLSHLVVLESLLGLPK